MTETEEEEVEEDPFDYIPTHRTSRLKKRRIQSQKLVTNAAAKVGTTKVENSKRKRKKKDSSPSSPSSPSTSCKSLILLEEADDEGGRCLICCMPWNLLYKWESRTVHASNCLETNFKTFPECQFGIHCDVTIRNHFLKFNHSQLAAAAAAVAPAFRESRRETPPPATPPATPPTPPTPPTRQNLVHDNNWTQIRNRKEKNGNDAIVEDLPEINRQKIVISSTETETPPTESDDAVNSPIKIRATEVSDGFLNINLRVDEGVALKTLDLKVPTKNNKVDVISSKATTTTTASPIIHNNNKDQSKLRQSTLAHFLNFGSSKSKGFIVPKTPTKASTTTTTNTSKVADSARRCPFYKKIAGTTFSVDAFSYGGTIPGIKYYFLSHFHYDHYGGLKRDFKHPIITSPVTARLVSLKIKVNSKYLKTIDVDESVIIDGIEVTALDANHCPGSVMFLFKFPSNGKCILHTGDFRADPKMEEYPLLWNNTVTSLHLDTTYCSEGYDFPSQDDVIHKTVDLIDKFIVTHPKILIVVGSYTIGKERIFLHLSEHIDSKIYTENKDKIRVLKCLHNPVLDKRLDTIPSSKSRIHICSMGQIAKHEFLSNYLKNYPGFEGILSIKPTGWTHSQGSNSKDSLTNLAIKKSKSYDKVWTLEVPYSEHSSYSEMKRFVQYLKLSQVEQIIPTVNIGTYESRYKMKKIFQTWIEK